MTGRDGTALRALAGIMQAISVLSGAEYVGDIPNEGWRVFRTTHDGLVAIISTGRPALDGKEELQRHSGVKGVPSPVW